MICLDIKLEFKGFYKSLILIEIMKNDMKCPECGKKMISGYANAVGGGGNGIAINWNNKKPGLFTLNNNMLCGDMSSWSKSSGLFKGYLCRKCKLVICRYGTIHKRNSDLRKRPNFIKKIIKNRRKK